MQDWVIIGLCAKFDKEYQFAIRERKDRKERGDTHNASIWSSRAGALREAWYTVREMAGLHFVPKKGEAGYYNYNEEI